MITNRMFLKNNELFLKACELAKTKPTKRQASKFRNNKGSAFIYKKQAEASLKTGGEV